LGYTLAEYSAPDIPGDAWIATSPQSIPVPPDKPRSGGEKWPNPHGYYDGVWWHQIPESERLGFLEGYIGCMSRDVKQPPEGYSRSASYYDNRIWSYLDAHPKAMNEAIANILSRYRDQINGIIGEWDRTWPSREESTRREMALNLAKQCPRGWFQWEPELEARRPSLLFRDTF
jgi:hypothetical protein